MCSAAAAALRRSRSKSRMQISGAGPPIHSLPGSVSCTRYSDKCERNRINGADSAKDCNTAKVSSSRQTPTTDRGSLLAKLSRGEPLGASLIDIGFISHSVAESLFYLVLPGLPAIPYQIVGCPGT